jgi:hypothetical protein
MRASVSSWLLPAIAGWAFVACGATSANAAGTVAHPRPAPVSKKVVTKPASPGATADTARTMTLKGGDEGTVFRTLTVEGEDRIHIEVERPVLKLDADPAKAPGLERGTVGDVLDRTAPDLEAPLLAASARETVPWVAHPWLAHFPEGAVARFRPAVTHVARWRLLVVNARAESVAVFRGEGDPPREIAWDGRTRDGTPVLPGTSYSYVFEAHDKAGNKRNFVGEGFRVNTFRYDTPQGPVLVFAGAELNRAGGEASGVDPTPPLVLQLASELNQAPSDRRVRIEVTARSTDEANAVGQRLMRWLAPQLLGDPARLESVGFVAAVAPVGAAVKVATETP